MHHLRGVPINSLMLSGAITSLVVLINYLLPQKAFGLLMAKTIGMRVPSNPIAQALLEALGEPMLSTSLMLPGSEFTESDPEEIKDRLEKQVDLIIHGGYLGQKPTTVIDLTDDTPVVVREGVGDVKPFL